VWAELLGIGDFYYELAVQVVEACWATRASNGGLLELRALLRLVQARRGPAAGEAVSQDDVGRALKKLKVLGTGFDIVTIGTRQFVRSVPGELDLDRTRALELAAGGRLAAAELAAAAGWGPERAQAALGALLADGVAMLDAQGPGGAAAPLCWFPCLSDGLSAAAAAPAADDAG